MAALLEESSRFFSSAGTFLVDLANKECGAHADPLWPGVDADLVGERTRTARCPPTHRRHRGEERRGVANRPRQRAVDTNAEVRVALIGAERDQTSCRLHTDQAAVRRRNTDRTGAISSMGHGAETCGQRRRRSPARSA